MISDNLGHPVFVSSFIRRGVFTDVYVIHSRCFSESVGKAGEVAIGLLDKILIS